MALADYLALEAMPVYGAALANMLLAVWIYSLAPREATHRAFALFLFTSGLIFFVIGLQAATPNVLEEQLFHHVEVLLIIAAFAPLLWFLLVYPYPRLEARRLRFVVMMGVVSVVAAWLAILFADGLVVAFDSVDEWTRVSVLYPLGAVALGSIGVGSWWLARAIARTHDENARRSLRLVVLGFALYPFYRSVRGASSLMDPNFHAATAEGAVYGRIFEGVLVIAGLFAVLAAWRLIQSRPGGSPWGLILSFLLAGTLGVATIVLSVPRAVTIGTVQMALPVLVTYALIRHHLFGIDLKVRWTISKTTLAGIFVAVFFVASEVAQQFFGERLGGPYAGIVAAGLLVFAIAPLSRFADRVAERAVPLESARAVPTTGSHEPEDLYRIALRVALRDRTITRTEEIDLHRLAAGLGIEPARAHELLAETEREATRGGRRET